MDVHLKVNDGKCDLLVIGISQEQAEVPNLSLKVGSADIRIFDIARNIGVIFYNKMTTKKHVSNMSKNAFSQLR